MGRGWGRERGVGHSGLVINTLQPSIDECKDDWRCKSSHYCTAKGRVCHTYNHLALSRCKCRCRPLPQSHPSCVAREHDHYVSLVCMWHCQVVLDCCPLQHTMVSCIHYTVSASSPPQWRKYILVRTILIISICVASLEVGLPNPIMQRVPRLKRFN